MNSRGIITQVDINDYLDSRWELVRDLLNPETKKKQRSEEIGREYDDELYGPLLKQYREDKAALWLRILAPEELEVVISLGESELVRTSYATYQWMRQGKFVSVLKKYHDRDRICELGAGYGQNLIVLESLLRAKTYGGELSKNAIELGNLHGLEIHPFNFCEPKSYEFITPGSTLFTHHAIEQVPDATAWIESLRAIRDRIGYVVQFEPMYRPERTGMLGRLRNRYAEINDYSQNLLSLLEADGEITVHEVEPDLYGLNPFNPTSLMVWSFKGSVA